jgi:hypothetical protein
MENLKMLNAFDAAAEEYCDYDGVNGGCQGAERLFDPYFLLPLRRYWRGAAVCKLAG